MKLLSILLIISSALSSYYCKDVPSFDAFSLVSLQLDFLQNMCFNRTGNVIAFEALHGVIQKCKGVIMNGTDLTYSMLTTKDPVEFYQFYTEHCDDPKVIQQRNECNDNIIFTLKQCLNSTEWQQFKKIEDVSIRLNKAICAIDRRNQVKQFFSLKGQECLADNFITIGYCMISVLPDDEKEMQDFIFKLIDGKECAVIGKIENCMMGELDACEEQTISNIFKLLFKFFRRELQCINFDKEEIHSSPVNSHGVSSTIKSTIMLLTTFLIATL